MIRPPTIMIGAETMTVMAIRTTVWTCWTSFVFRVISDAVPKWLTSRWEKATTLRKIALRRSRPNDIATLAAQQTATIEAMPSRTVTASIVPPVRRM